MVAIELFKNSVEIPSAETEALCAAACDANAYVVIGVCEKLPNTLGTLFNTQLNIGPDGRLIRKHQPEGTEQAARNLFWRGRAAVNPDRRRYRLVDITDRNAPRS
jgi:nitrilase